MKKIIVIIVSVVIISTIIGTIVESNHRQENQILVYLEEKYNTTFVINGRLKNNNRTFSCSPEKDRSVIFTVDEHYYFKPPMGFLPALPSKQYIDDFIDILKQTIINKMPESLTINSSGDIDIVARKVYCLFISINDEIIKYTQNTSYNFDVIIPISINAVSYDIKFLDNNLATIKEQLYSYFDNYS